MERGIKMSTQTKAVNLTEEEIKAVIAHNASYLLNNSAIELDHGEHIERLKTFKEPEITEIKSTNTAAGWGTPNA